MNGRTYAYLDLVALPAVGSVLLDPRPAFVFAGDGTRVLWANVAGSEFLGERDIAGVLERHFTSGSPLARHLARLAKLLPADRARLEILRFSFGVRQRTLACACQRLNLADGLSAVLAVGSVAPGHESIVTRAEDLADAIAGQDCLAAVLSADGRVLGASGGFSALAAVSTTIDELVRAVSGRRQRRREAGHRGRGRGTAGGRGAFRGGRPSVFPAHRRSRSKARHIRRRNTRNRAVAARAFRKRVRHRQRSRRGSAAGPDRVGRVPARTVARARRIAGSGARSIFPKRPRWAAGRSTRTPRDGDEPVAPSDVDDVARISIERGLRPTAPATLVPRRDAAREIRRGASTPLERCPPSGNRRPAGARPLRWSR